MPRASYGLMPAYIAWNVKSRCRRQSDRKRATRRWTVLNPPSATSRAIAAGLARSSGPSKLASMKVAYSAS